MVWKAFCPKVTGNYVANLVSLSAQTNTTQNKKKEFKVSPIFNSIYQGNIGGDKGGGQKYILNAQKYLLNVSLPVSALFSIFYTESSCSLKLLCLFIFHLQHFKMLYHLMLANKWTGLLFLCLPILFFFLFSWQLLSVFLIDGEKGHICIHTQTHSYMLIPFVSIVYAGKYQITTQNQHEFIS